VVTLGPQILKKPQWAWRMARDGMKFGGGDRTPMASISALSPFSWSDVEQIRSRWTGPLLAKGVLTARDAEKAVSCGCDGVIVSNHGGRQLEGAPATLRALPEVVAAVGERATVLLDGGVRRGSDVVKALALGARAVLVGRPYLYGLGAAGQPGVERVLEILEEEMSRTMALLGCESVRDLDPSWLQPTRRPWDLD
jgi:isopentenyl diphosphate isomerase/L-lactate dehydrogenase-like FMN-dependent dehydrogenase